MNVNDWDIALEKVGRPMGGRYVDDCVSNSIFRWNCRTVSAALHASLTNNCLALVVHTAAAAAAAAAVS